VLLCQAHKRFERCSLVAISSDYSTPVTVNGFSCRNCSDVDRAKRFIDPGKPQDGPFGINKPAKSADNHVLAVLNPDVLGQLHQQQIAPVSAAAQGYVPARRFAPGGLVSLTA
jgi:hypothetical protein